ncbi:MAG: hypothetical protein FJ291_17930 [Planctomycetes bacterium]|nr:hypothetical protein [Planctomycetota bacterium]
MHPATEGPHRMALSEKCARWLAAWAMLLVGAGALGQCLAGQQDWPADVPGWLPPKPGEHPRLLFRQADLPELKKRAETPEGKAIVKRLRFLLDGANGEGPPKKADKAGAEREVGSFTIGHAAGYGLLYLLTGEKKYAELGLGCFERMIAGERDRDMRYSFVNPNGELRSGSSWAVAALGYDLCYNGWAEADRARVAKAFLTTAKGQQGHDLEKVVRKPKYRPSKNHTGGIMCGAAAAAALYDDPGTEGAKIRQEWLPDAYRNTVAMLTEGFGDHGWYAESQGPSHVSSDTGLLLWLKAAKVACGKDFITPRPNAQYITLRWAMEIIPQEGRPQYPLRMAAGPSYGTHEFTRAGDWSHGGQFAQGFGAVDDKFKPALLWVYQSFVEPYEHKLCDQEKWFNQRGWLAPGEKTYDAMTSPWRAVMAFVNWPIGVEQKNPEGILPKAVEDRVHGYYCFRNRWKDADDIVATALLGYGPKDAYKPKFGPIVVWGLRKRLEFGIFTAPGPGEFAPKPDGSGTVSAGGKHLGVDFSGASGAPLLLAMVGIAGGASQGEARFTTLAAAGREIVILTLSKEPVPPPKAEGHKVLVGGQTITFDGKKLTFAK